MKHDKHNSRDSNQILLNNKNQELIVGDEVCYLRLPCCEFLVDLLHNLLLCYSNTIVLYGIYTSVTSISQ